MTPEIEKARVDLIQAKDLILVAIDTLIQPGQSDVPLIIIQGLSVASGCLSRAIERIEKL